jgi:hypothetical protein
MIIKGGGCLLSLFLLFCIYRVAAPNSWRKMTKSRERSAESWAGFIIRAQAHYRLNNSSFADFNQDIEGSQLSPSLEHEYGYTYELVFQDSERLIYLAKAKDDRLTRHLMFSPGTKVRDVVLGMHYKEIGEVSYVICKAALDTINEPDYKKLIFGDEQTLTCSEPLFLVSEGSLTKNNMP